MSGRDLRRFLFNHRAESAGSLVGKFLSGQSPSKTYKDVDYDSLTAEMRERKAKASRTLSKMRKVAQLTKITRTEQARKQHHVIWLKEAQRLASAQRKLEKELEIDDRSELKAFFLEAKALEEKYIRERAEFFKATVKPIIDLKEDLGAWMGGRGSGEEQNRVLEQVEFVKIQQEEVLALLDGEEREIELDVEELLSDVRDGDFRLEEGEDVWDMDDGFLPGDQIVPAEIFQWECCDERLRQSAVQEFEMLDLKYASCLDKLKEKYNDTISSAYGGWPKEDHWHFCVILDQYPVEMKNRRQLYIDRLLKEMPQWSRQQLVEHEEWHSAQRFYRRRRQAYLLSWIRSRQDVLAKVKQVYEEAWLAHEAALEVAQAREEQKEFCAELSEKLAQLRRRKLEVMEVEMKMDERRREVEMEGRRRQEERRRKEREEQKKRLDVYYAEQERMRKEDEDQDLARLNALKIEMEETAVRDRERIGFRKEEYEKKVKVRHEAEAALVEADKARERRLQKLRDQVQVSAERDAERATGATKASAAKEAKDIESDLQSPLFPVHSYTAEKILSDPRIRVETALRQANILCSDYARQVLSSIKPPQPPRKDQASDIFK